MNSLERFYATLAHQPVDRPLYWLGMPTREALPALFAYFNTEDLLELKELVDDDLYPVDLPYHHPPANHIACAFDFSDKNSSDYEKRSLTGSGYFARENDPRCVLDFPWPSPSRHIAAEECVKVASVVPDGKVGLGIMWSAHFQDACAAFGMEEALMAMILQPDMFRSVIDRIVEFYLGANEIFYRATVGKIHAVLLGNDMGTQKGLLVNPELLRQLVFPGIRRLIQQAHRHNLKVIYHSCGSIEPIIEDLIDAGADIIHPIQPLACDMDAGKLKQKYGERVIFCGGVDVQHLMREGTPEDVRSEVRKLKILFDNRFIFSPSHEALMEDVSPENVEAMFEEINKSLKAIEHENHK